MLNHCSICTMPIRDVANKTCEACRKRLRAAVEAFTPAELHALRQQINAALRVKRTGGTHGGRRPIPASCPKCGTPCDSKLAARLHCKPKPPSPVR